MLLMGLVVFGAAAAGGWYIRNSNATPPEKEEPTIDLSADPMQPVEVPSEESSLMPVAVRDEAMSVEELLRFSLSLKDREKNLKSSEEQFRQQQVQQQLVLTDIQQEQQLIQDLQSQVAAQVASAETMIDELNRIRETVISERERTKQEFSEIESKQIDIKEQHKANDKKLSTWLQGMTSEKAAAVLKEMANDGDLDVAVQLLANFEEREAAEILDAIGDAKLLNEFITAFRNLKSDKTSSKRKNGSVR